MRENNDLTFAKSRILVGIATGGHGHTRLNDQSIGLLAINRNVFGTALEIFGRLRKSSDVFGYYRSPTKTLDTLRIKMSRLGITKSWQVYKLSGFRQFSELRKRLILPCVRFYRM